MLPPLPLLFFFADVHAADAAADAFFFAFALFAMPLTPEEMV